MNEHAAQEPCGRSRIAITGGRGFVGGHVERELRERGYADVSVLGSQDYDLVQAAQAGQMFSDVRPEIVVHLAAAIGGIQANVAEAGWYAYANTMMGANVLEGARQHGARKVVLIGTTCVYPAGAVVPTPETSMFEGFPAADTAAYGIAKRNLWMMSAAYRQQYDLNSIFLIPANVYGPGDHFCEKRSHVIPALIRRCLEAKRDKRSELVIWGDGQATREFLYVEDAARGLVDAMELYDEPEPMNLGARTSTSIRELAELVVELTGYEGRIVWDTSKPTGAPRRGLDSGKAAQHIGYRARTDLRSGLKSTIEWYLQHERMTSCTKKTTVSAS